MKLPDILAAMLAACAMAACSGAPPDDGPDFEIADTPPPSTPIQGDAGGGGEEPDAAVTPPEKKAFRGTLAATDTVPFGGPPHYCKYEITLEAVTVDVAVEGDNVTAALVQNVAVENAIECPYAPSPKFTLDYALETATGAGDGFHLVLAGADANKTKTTLEVDLVPDGAGYEATLVWKRVDQKPPLDWTVTAKVLLAPE